LIVLEQETGLQNYVERGVPIDGLLTRQLLINLFYPNSPLHDGAAVVREGRIVAASVVLPLSDNTAATSQLGTRHRAALGISEQSDAIVVVISEETGQISIAENGHLMRNLDPERLDERLRSLLKLDHQEGEPGGLLQGLGERFRISPRGDLASNGSQRDGRAGKSSASTDVEASRSA
jgi:uncharacterized protein (TIGR00159 family)